LFDIAREDRTPSNAKLRFQCHGPLHVLVGSAGLKVYGAGQWRGETWHRQITPRLAQAASGGGTAKPSAVRKADLEVSPRLGRDKACPSPYASRQCQCGNSQRLTLEILIRLSVASDIRHLGNMTVLSVYLTPMPASVFTPPVQFELSYPEKPFL
jgi:hypothetical protein